MSKLSTDQHNIEIQKNLIRWNKKPTLQKIYLEFYKTIASNLNREIQGKIVELGSGISNMKIIIPEVICTDIFQNSRIDQIENAYHLSFENESVSNLILFDVWHHLQYPGSALSEFNRILKPNGRVIIFEPAMSISGFIIYGLFHHEPIGYFKEIKWESFSPDNHEKDEYYAALGNASRVFCSKRFNHLLTEWNIIRIQKKSAISYILSGGYSKPQLYPGKFLPILKLIEIFLDIFPGLFATRLLVALEKKS